MLNLLLTLNSKLSKWVLKYFVELGSLFFTFQYTQDQLNLINNRLGVVQTPEIHLN
jgi:hypothetical protein